MPSSRPQHIPEIIRIIRELRPKTILDLGTGFGKWGVLFREYTDIVQSENDLSRYRRDGWQVRIDGVEGYPEYITPVHNYVYNNLYEGDIRSILPSLGNYEVLFLGDVIEHFSKDEGVVLLNECKNHCEKAVLLSTPATFVEQGAACENDLEIHKSHWSPSDFNNLGLDSKIVEGDLLIACFTKKGVLNPLAGSAKPSLLNQLRDRFRI